jgi:hypothetical protein
MIHDMTTETVTKKLFSVDEFHRMCEVGILPEDSRFELTLISRDRRIGDYLRGPA